MDNVATRNLAHALMRQHGLGPEWTFRFDPRWSGNSCCHEKKLITLSEPITLRSDLSDVSLILLHEIAHALVGPGHGHDGVWKAKDLSIGGRGERFLAEKQRSMDSADIEWLIDSWENESETAQ
jgi:hypothetical protein